MIASGCLHVVNGLLDSRTIDVQARAGFADFGEFGDHRADSIALAATESAAVEAGGGDILAERAVEKRKALGGELLDSFGGDQKEGLMQASVNFGVVECVAGNATGGYFGR